MVVRKRRATYNSSDVIRKKRTSSPLSRPIQTVLKRHENKPKDDYVLKEVIQLCGIFRNNFRMKLLKRACAKRKNEKPFDFVF